VRYAIDSLGHRIEPTRITTGYCPGCDDMLVAKLGGIVEHHWAHPKGADCDAWYEGMTAWHRGWQDEFPEACREVRIPPHRADVMTPDGLVIEIQHSIIGPDEIEAREAFYVQHASRGMKWVFDATEASEKDRLRVRQHGPTGGRETYHSFRWCHARKSIATCKQPVVLDIGDGRLLEVRKIHNDSRFAGWGHVVDRASFVSRCLPVPSPIVRHTPGVFSWAP
jgi:competence protein CoiA